MRTKDFLEFKPFSTGPHTKPKSISFLLSLPTVRVPLSHTTGQPTHHLASKIQSKFGFMTGPILVAEEEVTRYIQTKIKEEEEKALRTTR